MIDKNSKIFLAGHRGFVGKTTLNNLQNKGFNNLIIKTKAELDLLNQNAVQNFFAKEKPQYVILCAAKVGGILPNSTKPAEFLYENLQIQNNVIHCAYLSGVEKLIFLASSCIYPRNSAQPMKEEYLFEGDFEPTNYGYAVAKAAGVKMCQAYNQQYKTNFISLNPSNLYGPGDDFDPTESHVLAALIRKVHMAKTNNDSSLTIWGDGSAYREWLFIEDLAEIITRILERDDINESLLNIGSGEDLTILDLVKTILKVLDYKCEIICDTSKPNGMPRKLLDVSRMHKYGLQSTTKLENGIQKTYEWFLKNAI